MHLYPNWWVLVNHNWGFRQVVIENIRNPAKFMICSKFAPNLMCLRHSDHHTSKVCQQHVQPSIFTGQITVHCDSIKSFGEDSVLKWPKPFVLFRAFGDNAPYPRRTSGSALKSKKLIQKTWIPSSWYCIFGILISWFIMLIIPKRYK